MVERPAARGAVPTALTVLAVPAAFWPKRPATAMTPSSCMFPDTDETSVGSNAMQIRISTIRTMKGMKAPMLS